MRGLLLVGILVALTLFINVSAFFDESLHPELEQLSTPQTVVTDGNAYPLIYGLAASDDKDMRSAGEAIFGRLSSQHERGARISLTSEEMNEILGGNDLDAAWQAKFTALACNTRLALVCADDLIGEIESAGIEDSRLRIQLARFEEILRQPRLEEMEEMSADSPPPAYGLLMRLARMRLGDSFQRDSTIEFLSRSMEDMTFWKMMLRDGDLLIAKMVAIAGLRNNLDFLAALLRERELSEDELQLLHDFVLPLTTDERDIGETFLAELRLVLLSEKPMVVALGEPGLLNRLTLQEQATINEYYMTTIVPLQLRASLTSQEFYAQRGYEPIPYVLRSFPPPLYNLGGKRILSEWVSRFNAQDYISRVHDMAARIDLVLLQAEIQQRGPQRIESLLQSSRQRNPYTGAAYEYDQQSQTIGFECLSDSNDVCRVFIGAL